MNRFREPWPRVSARLASLPSSCSCSRMTPVPAVSRLLAPRERPHMSRASKRVETEGNHRLEKDSSSSGTRLR